MTTPKPASAPQAADWQAMSDAIAYAPEDIRDAARLAFYRQHPTTAASAQVRAAEACGTCNGVGLLGGPVGQTPESLDWIEEPCPDCYPPIAKPATEPAPVAQPPMEDLLWRAVGNADEIISQLEATIADHTRREETLEAQLQDAWRELACSDDITGPTLCGAINQLQRAREAAEASLAACRADAERLDYIERTFSGMTNRERYLPVQMIWGKGCNGRTLREACDKYMKRDGARSQP